jgi:hypothetical protein
LCLALAACGSPRSRRALHDAIGPKRGEGVAPGGGVADVGLDEGEAGTGRDGLHVVVATPLGDPFCDNPGGRDTTDHGQAGQAGTGELATGANCCVSLLSSKSPSQLVKQMPKMGYFIAAALLLAAAVAAAFFWWTGFFGTPGETASVEISQPAPAASTAGGSLEQKLLAQMTDQAMQGGYAATFSGSSVKAWQIAAGHALERFSINGGEAVFARLTSTAPTAKEGWDWEQQGLSWLVPKQFNARTNGQKVEVGIIARQSGSNPNDTLSVLYATRGYGNSGWKKIPLSADFELKTFVFDFKAVEVEDFNQPILVMTADPDGAGRSVEILGVYVKPIPAPTP